MFGYQNKQLLLIGLHSRDGVCLGDYWLELSGQFRLILRSRGLESTENKTCNFCIFFHNYHRQSNTAISSPSILLFLLPVTHIYALLTDSLSSSPCTPVLSAPFFRHLPNYISLLIFSLFFLSLAIHSKILYSLLHNILVTYFVSVCYQLLGFGRFYVFASKVFKR